MAISTLYDYYTQKGQVLPSLTERAKLYEQQGLGSVAVYQGTAEQNTALLGKLQTAPTLSSIETGIKEVQAKIPEIQAGIAELPVKPVEPEVPAKDITIGTTELNVPTGGVGTNTDAFNKSLQASLEASKKLYEDALQKQRADLATQKSDYETKISDLETKQSVMVETDIKPLLEPFRQKLEETERTRLQVEDNYFANQKSIGELETLLTTGQSEIEAIKATPGLSAIKTGQINKKQEDISARAGVIQAVMSARNGQITVAYSLIDRTVEAITNDRKDQLTYYQTVYDIYEKQKDAFGNKLITVDKEDKDYIKQQISILEDQAKLDQNAVNTIKEAMLNPETASFYEGAGIKLTDTPVQIQKKLADYSYSQEIIELNNKMAGDGYKMLITPEQIATKETDPNVEVVRMKDSKGKEYAYWKAEKEKPAATASMGGFFTKEEVARLKVFGLDDDIYTGITNALTGGMELDEIRQTLRDMNLDPALLDKYDKAVGIEKVRGIQEKVEKEAPPTIVGNVKSLMFKNASIEDIENYINFSGYNPDSVQFKEILKDYLPKKKKGWWPF